MGGLVFKKMGSKRVRESFGVRRGVEENTISREELLITPKVLKTQKGQESLSRSVCFPGEVDSKTKKPWKDKVLFGLVIVR